MAEYSFGVSTHAVNIVRVNSLGLERYTIHWDKMDEPGVDVLFSVMLYVRQRDHGYFGVITSQILVLTNGDHKWYWENPPGLFRDIKPEYWSEEAMNVCRGAIGCFVNG